MGFGAKVGRRRKFATDEVFLNDVEGLPRALADILAAARGDDLIRTNRAFLLAIARKPSQSSVSDPLRRARGPRP